MENRHHEKIQVYRVPFSDAAQMAHVFAVRCRVFIDEQGVDRAEEVDAFESTSLHYLAKADELPVGTARWRITEKGIKLERFAVDLPYRGSGIGWMILQSVLADVRQPGVRVYLHAQVSAVGFYEKAGFVKEGPMFDESGIDHFTMRLEKR